MIYEPRPTLHRWLDPELDFVSFYVQNFPTKELQYLDRLEFASLILEYMLEHWRDHR